MIWLYITLGVSVVLNIILCVTLMKLHRKHAKSHNSDISTKYAQEMHMLTRGEFIAKYCNKCGSQRCEGIGTEWFEGCRHKDKLTETEEKQNESMD